MKEQEILERFEQYKNTAESVSDEQHFEAELDMLFYNGKSEALTIGLYAEQERAIVNFNHIKPVVDAVGGLFRQLRRKATYDSRDNDNERSNALSDVMNKAADVLRDGANMKYVESQQDRQMLITGLGGLDTGITFSTNPEGSVVAEVIPYSELFIDPNARQANLLDAEFIYRKKMLSIETALAMFPDSDVDDFMASGSTTIERVRDRTKPAYQDNRDTTVAEYDLVSLYKAEWKQLEAVRVYKNPAYSYFEDPLYVQRVKHALTEVADYIQEYIDENEDYEEGFKSDFDPTSELLVVPEQFTSVVEGVLEELGLVEYDERQRYCRYTAFIGDQAVLKAYKSIAQDVFAMQVKTAFYDEDSGTWYGMVRQMREPALYLNKTMTEMLFIIASRAKGGVLFETDAVYDAAEFEELYAQTNSAIEVQAGALRNAKIQPKQEPATATGYENIMATLYDLPTRIVGLNPQFLGQANDGQVSGVLEQQRIKQVQSVLADYIDSISLYQTEAARLMLNYIRYLVEVNDSFGVSVAGKDGRKAFIRLTNEIVDADYDVSLGEIPTGPAMKEAKAQMSLQFADRVAAMTGNVQVYAFAADAMDAYGFSERDIQKMLDLIKPEQSPEQMEAAKQQMQMRQQIAQMEMANKQADTQKKAAEVKKIQTEAEQKAIENELLVNKPVGQINVSV